MSKETTGITWRDEAAEAGVDTDGVKIQSPDEQEQHISKDTGLTHEDSEYDFDVTNDIFA